MQIDQTVIYDYVQDSLEVCRTWFRDHIEWETVPVTFTSTTSASGYVLFSSLSKPVYMVDMLLPVLLRSAGDFVLEEMSDLLGLPAGLFTSAATREYATWLQVRSMILKSMGKEMDWQVIGDRIYVDDIPHNQGQVTVIYSPLPQTLDEVTYGPAVNWIKRRVLAKAKIAQAAVIGKFSAGGINFTTNAETLRSEGVAEIEKLDEELKTLQFSYTSFNR